MDLATKMAASPRTASCFAQQWLRYAVGRELDSADKQELSGLVPQLARSGLNIRELIATVLQSEAFLGPVWKL